VKNALVFAMVVLLAVYLAACVPVTPLPEAQTDVKAAESTLCVSIEVFKASIEALQQVDASTTVEEFNQLKDAAAQAYEAMVAAWSDLQAAEVQVVESAMAEFETSLTQIAPEDTLGEVAVNVQTSAAAVKAAVNQLDQVACVEVK
jgi:hypothetical protein